MRFTRVRFPLNGAIFIIIYTHFAAPLKFVGYLSVVVKGHE